jgi:hypothetical protein
VAVSKRFPHPYVMDNWIGMFDGHMQAPANASGQSDPLSDELLLQIPARRGVFLLLGDDDQPIVMLSAADIRGRVKTRLAAPLEDHHGKTPDLRVITRKILWRLSNSYFETDLHFLELAQAVWPGDYQQLLSWRGACFIRVNPHERFPHFARTTELAGRDGQYIGPFGGTKSAERFISSIQEAFDLCRDVRCLRQSPDSQRCSYGQMGRCLCPCDGTISMEQYRKAIAKAAAFASGDRQTMRGDIQQSMKQAAVQLQFEKASVLKAKLERLGELDKPDYQHLASLEDFRFLIIQAGPSSRQAKAFFADSEKIHSLGQLDYPQLPQLVDLLARVQALAESADCARPGKWSVGLVSRYLYSSPERRGLILRWQPSCRPAELAQMIETSADLLHLKKPKARAKTPPPGPA